MSKCLLLSISINKNSNLNITFIIFLFKNAHVKVTKYPIEDIYSFFMIEYLMVFCYLKAFKHLNL
jgi:hypothetical protein